MENKMMPAVFVGHGSPMDAIGDGPAREGWKKMGEAIGKPKAIVALSAHWTTPGLHVRRAPDNPQVYDMYGFPQKLYQVKYSPASDTALADSVLYLLGKNVTPLNDWGLDHGLWSVLSNMYPLEDVPVVMVSVNANATPQEHFEVGRRLAPLRKEGVMILGSGNVVHNLRMVDWNMKGGFPWADAFDKKIKDAILSGDFKTPVEFLTLPDWVLPVASGEHYYPLLTVLGAASATDGNGPDGGESPEVTLWNDFRELGSISMTSYVFE